MLKLKSHTSVKRKLFLVHSNAGKFLWIMGLTTILMELRVRGGGFKPNSLKDSLKRSILASPFVGSNSVCIFHIKLHEKCCA